MQIRKFKPLIILAISILLMATLFAVSSFAAISAVDGVVIGLDANTSYEIAPVTLENYTAPTYTSVPDNSVEIEGLDAGIYYIKDTATNSITAVWVEGDAEARSDIGQLDYKNHTNSTTATQWLQVNNREAGFIAGIWTGSETANVSRTYYMSATGGNHVSRFTAAKAYKGIITTRNLLFAFNDVYFRYAYLPEEIIPVDELITMAFYTGRRQGSVLGINTSNTISSKYVLYTMDKTGAVTSHTLTLPTTYGTDRNYQIITPFADFPNIDHNSWIVGIDIYPYAGFTASNTRNATVEYMFSTGVNAEEIDAITWDSAWNTNESAGDKAIGVKFVNTCLAVEYIPDAYITKDELHDLSSMYQYNGANKAYIEGYADGSFRPDANITRAEAVTILSRLAAKDEIPYSSASSFIDCTPNDWYFANVAFAEKIGILSHIASTRFNPDEQITRGEAAQLINNILKFDSNSSSFSDVNDTHKYYSAIITLADNKIINGYADGTFRPDAKITRAELVTIINRAFNLIADKYTVDMGSIVKKFPDIDSHWAKYQILMAANNNVKSKNFANSDGSTLYETDTTICFENNWFKVTILKSNGKVTDIQNKVTGKSVWAPSTSSAFSYIKTDNGIMLTPKSAAIVNGRLEITYLNDTKSYFIIEATDNYITIENDSELPHGVSKLYFANFAVNSELSDDPDSYRLSAILMNINTGSNDYPGGESKKTSLFAFSKFGTIGAKGAIVYSQIGDVVTGPHRTHLKEAANAIDERVGLYSNSGGAFTLDNPTASHDCALLSSGLRPNNVDKYAHAMSSASIEQLDIHQGGSTFIQGDFNFTCASSTGSYNGTTFTSATEFKEKIGQTLIDAGLEMALHTYSSVVSPLAKNITRVPEWQKQISYTEDKILTLKEDITATDTIMLTEESAADIQNWGADAYNTTIVNASIPYIGPYTPYFLIDEEIFIASQVSETGLSSIKRAQAYTTATEHKAGAKIRQLLGHFGGFQPIPGSELFDHVAKLTGQAAYDGGFSIIYLDGYESFCREPFTISEDRWYYYARFAHEILLNYSGDRDPLIEGSSVLPSYWNARGRFGTIDHYSREYKKANLNHANDNMAFVNYRFAVTTLGWFNYAPDMALGYKNTHSKTLFKDDLDHLGAIAIAYDMPTTVQPYSYSNCTTYQQFYNNTVYYGIYSKLRKEGYFSDAVKDTLFANLNNGLEYKLERQGANDWAFREMQYVKHRIFDDTDDLFMSGTYTNPYDAQVPYIRIEPRYSTLGNEELVVVELDENAEVSTIVGKSNRIEFETKNLSSSTASADASKFCDKTALKINVTGNGIEGSAILLSLELEGNGSGRADYFIPTDHTGTREFILMDLDNADWDGYNFGGELSLAGHANATYRTTVAFNKIAKLTVHSAGDVTGVKIDDLRAYRPTSAPVTNPSITVNGKTMTFNTTVKSGEYIEYYPELGKAYLHAYNDDVYNNSVYAETNGDKETVSVINVSGDIIEIPSGEFTFTYAATSTTDAPHRAKLVFGFKGGLIENEETWSAPEVEIDDIEYVTLVNRTSGTLDPVEE